MTGGKCLIFSNYPLNASDGGPSGFLAQNLRGWEGAHWKLGGCNVDSFHHERRFLGIHHRMRAAEAVYAMRGTGLPRRSWFFDQVVQARRAFRGAQAGEYGSLWFHDVYTAFACKDLIHPEQYVILQSHSPELPSQDARTFGAKDDAVTWMEKAEAFAFQRANEVVLPNLHTREIYDPILKPNCRLTCLMSGCAEVQPRFVLPLDPACRYFLYLGRRHQIKGYDLIFKAFQSAYRSDPSIRLVLVGRGEKVECPGVIDVGFSSEAAAWMASCDYMVSANRQSYFDLSLMEALSAGTPLIVCCTGGHRMFLEQEYPGILALAGNDSESLSRAMLASKRSRSENADAVVANRRLYEEYFSSAHYRKRIDDFLAARAGGENASEESLEECAATTKLKASEVSPRAVLSRDQR